MNIKSLVLLLVVLPISVFAATRDSNVRIGVNRMSMAGVRGANMSASLKTGDDKSETDSVKKTLTKNVSGAAKTDVDKNKESEEKDVIEEKEIDGDKCRLDYRSCMDDFCLLDESEGGRCACSDNINKSKSLIQEIQDIQKQASSLYTEGVEREKLGAKAILVFGESDRAKKASRVSGIDLSLWLSGDGGDLSADDDIGDSLYAMAADSCAYVLKSCASRASMEEKLYSRQVVQDCKAFDSYLKEQKNAAESNKNTAQAAVRKARLEMLDTTNKYNRGECLLAYKSCVADKGGCGVNFENCLDASLLERRSNACENILNQCMAVKDIVLQDWQDESSYILAEAAKYVDKNRRGTCLAKIQNCLEEGCSTTTESACLTNINVAAGICPIITECDELVPGLKNVVKDKLGYLQTKFCENDVDKCLQERCGKNYTAPECVGKKPMEIAALCPQDMFPSCKKTAQFDIIVQAAMLQMDYQMLQGCLNYFGEKLNTVCGTDMNCLPKSNIVAGLTELPDGENAIAVLRNEVRAESMSAVSEFFVKLEQDKTVSACKDSQKPSGQRNLGDVVFNTARMIAEINAENRALGELEVKIAELSRKRDVEQARKVCLETYVVETSKNDSKESYSYIRSVSFEPDLRNCHVCRIQQVCEVGGESKASAALKAGAGAMSAGASAGTMVTPGWGTAIGAAVGLVGGGVMGYMSGGKETYCQQIESCEDINM